MVTTAVNTSGTAITSSDQRRPLRAKTTRQIARAIAASSWLAMPNSGNRVLMPPSGSSTPMSRIDPQPATITAVVIQAPSRHEWSRKRWLMPPRASDSMKRATRVPASTLVRMNSASNMIAKWYQNAIMPGPPMRRCMMPARPTARVGAPPVRETIDSSPTSFAVCVRVAGSRFTPMSPREFTNCAAPSTVPPVAAAEEFMAK